jgi:hypothetical protein
VICNHDVAETTSIRENKEEKERSRGIKGKRIGVRSNARHYSKHKKE